MGRLSGILVLTIAPGLAGTSVAAQSYDAPETRQLVESLVESHGGHGPWEGAGAVRYDHIMFTPRLIQEGDTHWWISRETIERGGPRAYHEWPIDGAKLAHDGEGVWSTEWKRPNPPAGMLRIHYVLTFLTWLTRDEAASLTRVEPVTLPGDEVESLAVDVAFGDAEPGLSVYIDPETHRLRGFRNGRSIHAIHRYGEVDGLLVPSDWTTYVGDQVIGHHSVINVAFLDRFDASLVVAPPGASRGS